MYRIPETFSVRVDGKLLVFAAGARGVQTHEPTGDILDLDAQLERSVLAKLLKQLLADGKIVAE